MKKSYIILGLFLVLVISAVFRLYSLYSIPPGVNRDEASIGFTAYSILKTGADEYGRHLPLSFQSFGDWKLPLYIYTVVPFVSFLGLNELAVRLPSAIFGISSIFLLFFTAKALLKDSKMALLVALLSGLEPWSIHLSRVESESNTAVFLSLAGLLLFFHAAQNKKAWAFIPSGILFALTYFTYAGNHVFTTLFVLGLFVIYRKSIQRSKEFFIGVTAFFLLVIFILYQTLIVADRTKLSGIGIFGDPSVVHAQIEIPRIQHSNQNSIFARLVHNRIEFGFEHFVQNYINSFSPQFLFISGGDNHAHNIENFGNMYLFEAIFFYLGIFLVLLKRSSKENSLILWWILIGPIAASITKDAPHTNRMFAVFPALPIVTAMGLSESYKFIQGKFKDKSIQALFICLIGFFYIYNVLVYVDRYFVHFPKNEAQYWGEGYKELSLVLTKNEFKNKSVVISQPQTSPYIFLLFYQKYDPGLYRKQAIRYQPTDDGFVHVKQFGRFEFRPIDWSGDLSAGKILVDDPNNVPPEVKNKYTIADITLPNGKVEFSIIKK